MCHIAVNSTTHASENIHFLPDCDVSEIIRGVVMREHLPRVAPMFVPRLGMMPVV